jgi:hypothetical protein
MEKNQTLWNETLKQVAFKHRYAIITSIKRGNQGCIECVPGSASAGSWQPEQAPSNARAKTVQSDALSQTGRLIPPVALHLQDKQKIGKVPKNHKFSHSRKMNQLLHNVFKKHSDSENVISMTTQNPNYW